MKYIYLISVILLCTACSPTTTPAQPSVQMTETLPVLFTPEIATPTLMPVFTEMAGSAFTPVPTSTALAELQPGQHLTLAYIHMIDEQNGWGIDISDHIVHTIDAGGSWKDITPPNGVYQDAGFFALDANIAWATPHIDSCVIENCTPVSNSASVWFTTDGGNTWQEQYVCLQGDACNFDFDVFSPDYYRPIAIQFLDQTTGWLLVSVYHVMFQDRYRLYQTTDGGAHWSPIMDSLTGPMTMQATGLAFQDRQIGWMTNSQINGASDPTADWSVYQSTDSGRTWNAIQLPEPNPLPETFVHKIVWCGAQGVNAIPPDSVGVSIHCAVMEPNTPASYDYYFHSNDGGSNWISWPETGDVEFINPLVGWRLSLNNGAYDLERTRDGGQTWDRLKTVQWKGDLDFVNEETGWAIATNGDAVALVHTTDGGKTWQEIQPLVAAN